MSLKSILEPIIVTFNRLEGLQNTLNQLIDKDCPIKDCEITILDNCSTDGTKEFCESFCAEHSNFKYIRHSKNIGLSGNVIEAMRKVSKKWLWILGDDDDFQWDNWDEIEQALYKDYGAVHTRQNMVNKNDYPHLINDEAFLSNAIYNTKHITDVTIQNAYGIAHTLCPHHAIGAKLINENVKIFVPAKVKEIIIAGTNDCSKKDWFRIPKQNLYDRFANYNILLGYINSYSLIENYEMRQNCISVLCQGLPFKDSLNMLFNFNKNFKLSYLFEVMTVIDKQKLNDIIYSLFIKKQNKRIKNEYIAFMLLNWFIILKVFLKHCFCIKKYRWKNKN